MTLPTREFRFSSQVGQPWHCTVAQVWNYDGSGLARIEPLHDPADASCLARLFAKSPRLAELLELVLDSCAEPELSRDYDVFARARAASRELLAELRS